MKNVLRVCREGHAPEIYGCFDGKREMYCNICNYEGKCQHIAEYKASLQLNSVPGICNECLKKHHEAYCGTRRLRMGDGSTNRLLPVFDKSA